MPSCSRRCGRPTTGPARTP